jgi:osmoprotectant transport system permease protein
VGDALHGFWHIVSEAQSWQGQRGIGVRLYDHIRISVLAVAVAGVIGLPPAIVLGHLRRGGLFAVSVVNIGRALPSFAVIALVFPISSAWGFNMGFWPTLIALVLLALPPMFTNAYTGVRQVDPAMVESARGMGMNPGQVLWRVELPTALPLVITGVRVSAVQVVATATLGALVAFGGLGAFIIEGFANQDDGRILVGAVFVALLALLTEGFFTIVERLATPWVPRRRGRRGDVTVAALDVITDNAVPDPGAA